MTETTPAEARAGLADAFSIWRLMPGTVAGVIGAATECLVAGVDSPRLRELAGASPRESQFVLQPLIEDTLDELGLHGVRASNVQHAALTAMLHRLEGGTVTERDLARWAHTHIGHDGDARCQVFVDLDDMYDVSESGILYSLQDLDHWVRDETGAFLQGLPAVGRTRIWREPASRSVMICGPRRGSRRFFVRVLPSGREFRARNWDDLWSSLPEMGVPWRNVSFESDDVRALVMKRWGGHPDAPEPEG